MAKNYLSVWTVFDHPTDYPEVFIARKWLLISGVAVATSETVTGPTLQSVRDKIPPGLHRFPRSPEDDVYIVESWL